jgi:hypothetical protein
VPQLSELVLAELTLPVDPRVSQMAAAIASRHGNAAEGVLFYGSCLRSAELEGQMLDFYLVVSSYRDAYEKRWLAAANRLIPPNVFPFEQKGLAAKYAVLSQADLARLNSPAADNVSVWARFAQPSRLVWVANDDARARIVEAVAQAAPTLFQLTLPMANEPTNALEIWKKGFALTYGAELRAERQDRSGSIVDTDPERYLRFGDAVLAASAQLPKVTDVDCQWRRLQRRGKWLSVARLAKASLTFAGGIDYLAWKINRHAGTDIAIRPWQRRWPLLGAATLLPRLLRKGAVR